MNSKKLIVASAVLFYGISEAQQSAYYSNKDDYRFELAENLYQTRIYNASQYHYAQEFFYNESISKSRKEASQFFDNVIGVVLQKNHAEKGLDAFMKEYPGLDPNKTGGKKYKVKDPSTGKMVEMTATEAFSKYLSSNYITTVDTNMSWKPTGNTKKEMVECINKRVQLLESWL